MISLKFHCSPFQHDGVKHLSMFIMTYRDNDCIDAFHRDEYMTSADQAFDHAIGVSSMALSIRSLLEALGMQVWVEDGITSASHICDILRAEYNKCS